MGFRSHALRFVFGMTDTTLRDPDTGSASPGGCPGDAGSTEVVAAAADLGATVAGISLYSPVAESGFDAVTPLYDSDGDGKVDRHLDFVWASYPSDLNTIVQNVVERTIADLKLSNVESTISGGDPGFVTSVEPASYSDVSGLDTGSSLTFTLHLDGVVAPTEADQVTHLTMKAIGDYNLLLGTQDVFVIVPGTSR